MSLLLLGTSDNMSSKVDYLPNSATRVPVTYAGSMLVDFLGALDAEISLCIVLTFSLLIGSL